MVIFFGSQAAWAGDPEPKATPVVAKPAAANPANFK
jgi:hypothetical protein